MSGAELTIMSRAPLLGRVKTRLAAEIGAEAALAFYRDCLFAIARRLGADARWRTTLCVTPDESAADDAPWPPRIERRPQGEGDLGARMLRALSRATPVAPVAVIGADIPDIQPDDVAAALDALRDRSESVALGPSADGGFWLIAAARPLPGALFDGARWSHPRVLEETEARLAAIGRPTLCGRMLRDIDTAADLEAWRERERGA